jgi:hypothetical protein
MEDLRISYLNSMLNTVLYKDVITRHKIRDASIFDKLVRYLFDNVRPQRPVKLTILTAMGKYHAEHYWDRPLFPLWIFRRLVY